MTEDQFEVLTGRARAMRHQGAPAEMVLWSRLRDRHLGGFKWRRQQPRDGFVTDFYCAECGLVVELDGDSHTEPGAAAKDLARTAIIEREGRRVIRFVNTDVFDNLDAVLEVILTACVSRSDPSP